MRSRRASRTAELVAGVRAAHLRYDSPIVFRDPYAVNLTSSLWRFIATNRWAYRIVAEWMLKTLRPVRGQILGRARYCDELLENAVQRGVRQCVIVGAGLDSFAIRRPDLAKMLTIYELDHPNSQAIKRHRLASMSASPPQSLIYVPVDFEHSTVISALGTTSFRFDEPAFFSWLGTTLYVSEEAVFATLADIASNAAKTSELLVDYSVSEHLLRGLDRKELIALKKLVERLGEPFRANFAPDDLEVKVKQLGYRVIEHLAYEDQRRRFFSDRRDDLRPSAFSNFLRLGIQ